MTRAAPALTFEIADQRWSAGPETYDLSIPLEFDRAQPSFFGVSAAAEKVVKVGAFTGDVRLGGSCNCSTYTLTPHCNGTHTECVGHVTAERLSVRDLCTEALTIALLLSVAAQPAAATRETTTPRPQPEDWVLTRASIEAAVRAAELDEFCALVIRTQPNDADKLVQNYDERPAPYFTVEAMQWIVDRGVRHLVVDLPSVDRANDEGRLTAHRIFWNVPQGSTSIAPNTRRDATITELAFVPDSVPDGPYLLNLQVAPFAADAAPSRPILMPLRRV
jgi:arylformamidase